MSIPLDVNSSPLFKPAPATGNTPSAATSAAPSVALQTPAPSSAALLASHRAASRPPTANALLAPTNAVSLKLPPFWSKDPALWFAQLEAVFATGAITRQTTRVRVCRRRPRARGRCRGPRPHPVSTGSTVLRRVEGDSDPSHGDLPAAASTPATDAGGAGRPDTQPAAAPHAAIVEQRTNGYKLTSGALHSAFAIWHPDGVGLLDRHTTAGSSCGDGGPHYVGVSSLGQASHSCQYAGFRPSACHRG